MTDEPCCSRCRFSRIGSEFDEGVETGDIPVDELLILECHRHAPPIVTVRDRHRDEDAETEWKWPVVMVGDWCGDFFPKATA